MHNKNIRNFAIIAHIDHGKSTLADRFIEICQNLKKNEIKNQMLDSMDLEREKGITIKSQCLTLNYKLNDENYTLNLIDTPGHSDFSYEVSRALEACDGVILLIDATQGIEAQTLSNYQKALEKNLYTIIALNKIDLNIPDITKIKNDITTILNEKNIIEISAKTGYGVKNLIKTLITKIPKPNGSQDDKLEVLIIDSWFNNYLGVTCLINVKNGIIQKNDKIITISTNKIHKISQLGIFNPKKIYKNSLSSGEIGFITLGCKNINEIQVGDTITLHSNPLTKQITKLKKITPRIFANIFPLTTEKFGNLKDALEKLSLNDSSIEYSPQKSNIFGFGFKCGFLGLLHLDITKERLEREYNLKTIITPPNVVFKIIKKDNTEKYINTPSELDNIHNLKEIQEPIALVTILVPPEYIGKIITLCNEKKGIQITLNYHKTKTTIIYHIPLNEIIFNFFDKLQTTSNGLASMDYKLITYTKSNLTKLNILINDKRIDMLEFIIHKDESYKKGKELIDKLKNIIPKQLFEIKIQAAIENKIIARTTIKALKKDVLSKCYGGDITRKKKLLKKQKIGKKRLKKNSNIDIPKNIFAKIIDI